MVLCLGINLDVQTRVAKWISKNGNNFKTTGKLYKSLHYTKIKMKIEDPM